MEVAGCITGGLKSSAKGGSSYLHLFSLSRPLDTYQSKRDSRRERNQLKSSTINPTLPFRHVTMPRRGFLMLMTCCSTALVSFR